MIGFQLHDFLVGRKDTLETINAQLFPVGGDEQAENL